MWTHNYSAIPPLLLKNLIADLYKKTEFENINVIDCDFSTKSSQNSTIFAMLRFPGGYKICTVCRVPVKYFRFE